MRRRRNRAPKKGQPKKRSPSSDAVLSEVDNWLKDQPTEEAADYARRGRRFINLSDGELREAWIRAFEALSRDPANDVKLLQHHDLAAEIGLRGSDPPFEAVEQAMEVLKKKALKAAKDANPKRRNEVGAEIVEEVITYVRRRDSSRH